MRQIRAAIALTFLLAIGGCGSNAKPAASPSTTTTTTSASANGPYAVGSRTFTFVDTSRKTMANGSEPEKPSRTLETIVDYPKATGKFPVIVYLHGFGAHADNPYSEPFAKAGFVAVAIKFPLTNTEAPGGPNPSDASNEPADVAFVLSQLAKDPDLGSIADTQTTGLFGESLGANVAMNIGLVPADYDARVKTVVAASGGCADCPHNFSYTKGAPPVMFVHGTKDPAVPYQWSADEYAKATAPKFFLTLTGAMHVQYGEPWEPIVAKSSIDFFDRYLKNDDGALGRLTEDANVAGTTTLKSQPT
jgi:predicted dienelactone hydrolase